MTVVRQAGIDTECVDLPGVRNDKAIYTQGCPVHGIEHVQRDGHGLARSEHPRDFRGRTYLRCGA